MKPQQRTSEIFDLPAGTMLGGKYELLRKIATGGMAEIYLARTRGQAGFEKLVVVKRILPSVSNDPSFVRMFLDEARLAATLRHPNIADVYEVGEDDGAPFFAMEFIHGQDVRGIKFAARGKKEHVPLAVSLAIVHGIASALDYAHDVTGPDGKPLNLVHRDVSASNLLISYEGAIKLIDFGIARAQGVTQQTQVGTLKGKIPYMSPEQCRGMRLDRRSDLFSLGVCFYELTVGQRPFIGENDFVIMDKIVHHGAQAPSEIVKNYPPELERMVMKLLQRKPEDRYQTAEEFLHELDPYIAQHRLYMSAKSMSKYMRAEFADKLEGLEDDNPDAVTRHILSGITGDSRNSQVLFTPPSSFPAVLPASQEMAAVGVQISEQFSRPSISEVIDAPAVYPELRPKRGGRVLVVLLGLAALGTGAYFGLEFVKSQQADEPAPAAAAPRTPQQPAAAPTPPPVEPKQEAATPRPPTVEVKEEVKEEVQQPAHEEVVTTKPEPEKVAVKKPVVVKKPAKKEVKPVTPPKEVKPEKPPEKPVKKDPPKKDPGWDKDDKDSPFLP